jgi:hypothetical protein
MGPVRARCSHRPAGDLVYPRRIRSTIIMLPTGSTAPILVRSGVFPEET